ncbi:hypothetical protein GCM10010885_01080 [Alicyclobacillus cellulosilyticus]|uniref:NodB homology domain-containing protein n=1 Tax=Alicyclobacillus cellulosilyticus TaxID=1003997 RepID=A0A917K2K6_9BACL|nr:polysaccharide deacetylase family protein [Alicyclobacillus cellulosilyticus]GGI95269.1 hypothetical protein GCM10010885_01080 [Alicyclobacillus cellulosilyticus]
MADKTLFFTFDDGPDDRLTPKVLDILARYGVRATFFCLGAHVAQHPAVFRRMLAEGHCVGNHSWDHPYLTKEPQERVRQQLAQTARVMTETAGVQPRWFRPPYGDVNDLVAEEARRQGYELVLWDVDSRDWSGIPGPAVAANVLPRLRPGAVLLHHCAWNAEGTVDALPYVIEVAAALGYRFAGLDEWSPGTPAQAACGGEAGGSAG